MKEVKTKIRANLLNIKQKIKKSAKIHLQKKTKQWLSRKKKVIDKEIIDTINNAAISFEEIVQKISDHKKVFQPIRKLVIDIGQYIVDGNISTDGIVDFIENIPSSVYQHILPERKRGGGGINFWKRESEKLLAETEELAAKGNIKEINHLVQKFILRFNVTILFKEYSFLQTGKSLGLHNTTTVVSVEERMAYLLAVRDWRKEWCSQYLTLCPIDPDMFLNLSSTMFTVSVLSGYFVGNDKNKPMVNFIIEKGMYPDDAKMNIPSSMRFDLFIEQSKRLRQMYLPTPTITKLQDQINLLSKNKVEEEYQKNKRLQSNIIAQYDTLWFFQTKEREELDRKYMELIKRNEFLKEQIALHVVDSTNREVEIRKKLQKEKSNNQIFNNKWVSEAQQFLDDFHHFVKEFFPFVSIMAKETFKPGMFSWIPGTISFTQEDFDKVNSIVSDTLMHQIFLCQNMKEKLPKWFCTTGVGATYKKKKEKLQSLNKLWGKKCGLNKRWGIEGAFCRAGMGEIVPMLLMSIQFVPIQTTPKKHILYTAFSKIEKHQLTENSKINTLIRYIAKKVISAYDKVLKHGGQFMSIQDLDTVAQGYLMIQKFSKFIRTLGHIYGLSVGVDPSYKHLFQKKEIKRTIDLDRFAKSHCHVEPGRAPSEWYHSVLCYMARMSPLAHVIGSLQFTVPPKMDKHVMFMLLDVLQDVIKKKVKAKTSSFPSLQKKIDQFDLKNRIYNVPLINNIYKKIQQGKPLLWSDIDYVYKVLLDLPKIGGMVTWKALNEHFKDKGIKFSPLDQMTK